MKIICNILFCFLFMLFSVQFIYANPKSIRIATGEWPPYTSEKISGYGFFSEIVIQSFKEEKVEVDCKFYPWKRCEVLLQKKRIDAIFPYVKTKTREEIYYYSKVVFVSTGKFFYRSKDKSFKIVYKELSDLKNFKIAGVLGYWYDKILKDAGLKITYTPSDIHAFKQLYHGRVDLVPSDELVGNYLLNKMKKKNERFVTIEKPLNVSNLHLITSYENKDYLKIIEIFNSGLEKIKKKKIYNKILKKYQLKN